MVQTVHRLCRKGSRRHRTCVPGRENTTRVPTRVLSRGRLSHMGGPYDANRLQAGFLTCILPRGSFPFADGEQWTTPRRFPKRLSRWKCGVSRTRATSHSQLSSGADAHSGATVADSHRVPVWVSQGPGLETCSRAMHFTKSPYVQTDGTGRLLTRQAENSRWGRGPAEMCLLSRRPGVS